MATALRWTWFWGRQPWGEEQQGWLDQTRPLSRAEADTLARQVAYSPSLIGSVFERFYLCDYNERTGGFGPWRPIKPG